MWRIDDDDSEFTNSSVADYDCDSDCYDEHDDLWDPMPGQD